MRFLSAPDKERLYAEAKVSERRRSHFLLHKAHTDKVQRLLIALVSDSYVEPHYHSEAHQWEMFFVLEGNLKITLHKPDGRVKEQFMVGDDYSRFAVELSPGEIHSVTCVSSRALLLEVKEGPFIEATAKTIL